MTTEPGARGRRHAVRALLSSLLAVVPFSIGTLTDVANGTAATPLAADPGFTLLALGALLVVAALASIPVGVVTYLLDRVVDRVWLSRGGRLAAGTVANALVGAGAGLLLGGLVAPMWRPLDRALVFTAPWAIAAAALFVLAAVLERRRAASAR
ncbi:MULTISPECIES: hypothetical protein [unclassified Rathayibacter]|uniref:hypothetical protein n=1 Tax=unclassified Rathayibacter TaxID=2609250 RepID=UPI0007015058|nr:MULTISPECIES: hypothetical protein [unclassified Rathayibacter]KQQ05586.1 hypothetical protein ASF42_03180 [Rathayibacter sp. Leaf294]KQS13447.1 hypothetical protein ASG06_03190 [Rathayibacter sp. Leaf185]